MVLGHSLGGNQGQWAPLVEHFGRTHRVVTFALAGSSEANPAIFSPVRHASVMGFADDLALLCAELGLRGAVYVGHSLSGMAGALAAAADPGMFSRLVLVNASARYVEDPQDGYVGAFSQREVDDMLKAIAGDFTLWSSGFAALAVGNLDRPALAREFARSLSACDPLVTLTLFRTTLTSDLRALVPKVRVPTLVLQSATDPVVPLEAAQWLADHLPDARLRVLNCTGHFPHLAAPDEVIAELEAFGLAP